MRLRRALLLAATLVVAAGALRCLTTSPSTSRDWAVDQATPATATIDGHRVHIQHVRDFRYDSAGHPAPGYYDADYDLDSLETVWFALTTFSKQWRAPAHTFVSFGFAGGKYVAISVEARRERGESYSILAGLVHTYELVYIIGDERDLVGRRAVIEGDNTYLYPVRAPREKIRQMFVAMLDRANRLQLQPEFYNSLFNSCTSNLVMHVNQVAPGRIPAGWKVLVPGYADDVAQSLGLIDATGSQFLINERARAAMASDSFSVRIRRS